LTSLDKLNYSSGTPTLEGANVSIKVIHSILNSAPKKYIANSFENKQSFINFCFGKLFDLRQDDQSFKQCSKLVEQSCKFLKIDLKNEQNPMQIAV